MPVPPPTWRVKRRPCPFFWQGKCLFADSCNFLHTINPPAPTIVVNTASPESISSQNRTSIESQRGIEGILADDEDSLSSRDSDNGDGEGLSNDWIHLSQAQAMSTPTNQTAPVASGSDAHVDHRDELDTDTQSAQYSTSSLPYDRSRTPSGTRTDSYASSSGSSDGRPRSAIGLGLILTPISPPRDLRQNFVLGHPPGSTGPQRVDSISIDGVSIAPEEDVVLPHGPRHLVSRDTMDATTGVDDMDAYDEYFQDESVLGQAPVSSPPPMAPSDLQEHHSHSSITEPPYDPDSKTSEHGYLNRTLRPVSTQAAAAFYPSPSSPQAEVPSTLPLNDSGGVTSTATPPRLLSERVHSSPHATGVPCQSTVDHPARSRADTASSSRSINSLEGAAIFPVQKAAQTLAQVMLSALPPRSATSVPWQEQATADTSPRTTLSAEVETKTTPRVSFFRPPAARRVARARSPRVRPDRMALSRHRADEQKPESSFVPSGSLTSVSQSGGMELTQLASSRPSREALLSPLQLRCATKASADYVYSTPTPAGVPRSTVPIDRTDCALHNPSDSACHAGDEDTVTFYAGTPVADCSSSRDGHCDKSQSATHSQGTAMSITDGQTTSEMSNGPNLDRSQSPIEPVARSAHRDVVPTMQQLHIGVTPGRSSPVPPPSAPPSFGRHEAWHNQVALSDDEKDVTIHAGARNMEPPLRSAPLASIHSGPLFDKRRRSRSSRDTTEDAATDHETGSTSSRSSISTAPSWLKPLRLGSTTPAFSDDTTGTGRASRPVSVYSVASVARGPPTILSRCDMSTGISRPSNVPTGPPSVASSSRPSPQPRPSSALRLDTAIASHRNSAISHRFPFASASPSPPHLHAPPQASPESTITAASIPLPQIPLLPPAQIYTSTSRSLSPPHNHPLFKLSDPLTPSPSFSIPLSPFIYSPPLATSIIDRSSASLLFAIASDDKTQVTQSLKDASPNTAVGPGEVPALVFTITNAQLSNKLSIVKTLLEHGADPAVVFEDSSDPTSSMLKSTVEDDVSPAMKYYLERAAALNKDPMAEALRKSDMASICGAGFRIVGQDHMLRHLYRAIRLYISGAMANPFVAILAGPSGLGKSYIAKQFGEILSVPAHIINLSSLRSQSSLLEMKPALIDAAANSACALQDFLATNDGQRCVVVLEDIEKVEDINALHSLIVPFELGRFLLGSGAYVDTSKVLWFATSSIGTASVLELYSEGSVTDSVYRQMMAKARSELATVLGASLVSRVGSVLPFVPFSSTEKGVIVCEAASAVLARVGESYAPDKMDELVRRIVAEHHEIDGRGLLRAVAEQF